MKDKSSWLRRNLPLIVLFILPLIVLYPVTQVVMAKATKAPLLTQDEQEMLDMINNERNLQGLEPLEADAHLTKIARYHSQEMIDLNYFSHVSPTLGSFKSRLAFIGIKDHEGEGENIVAASSIELAFIQLMTSPEHKENMLNPNYTHIGIGIRDGGEYGKMVTQDFIEQEKEGGPVQQGAILAGLNFIVVMALAALKKLFVAVSHAFSHIKPHRPYFFPSA